jgi:hypothetical protein
MNLLKCFEKYFRFFIKKPKETTIGPFPGGKNGTDMMFNLKLVLKKRQSSRSARGIHADLCVGREKQK